jgi:putative nucleotidyltransferase with HDIG domain
MSIQHPTSAESLVQEVSTMYTLPATFHQLTKAINNPDSTLDDIAEVISNDQSVAMRVLQLANSAFFSFPSKVETITHALTLVGIQQMRDLIQGTAVIEMFEGLPTEHITMKSFWEHSIACGLAAKAIATLRREANVERFFVLGLLHDVGRMVMFQHATQSIGSLIQEAQEKSKLLFQVEQERLGFHHADVSASLMEQWSFPYRLVQGVKDHHHFSSAKPFAVENACLQIADALVHTLQIGKSGEGLVPPPDASAWAHLGLSLDSLPAMARQVEREFAEVVKIMLYAN